MLELGQVKEVYIRGYQDAQEDLLVYCQNREADSLDKLAEEFFEYYAIKHITKEKQND